MANPYVFEIDGYEFPRADVPARGPIVEQSPQKWSKYDIIGGGSPGTILTYLGAASQEWDYVSNATAATLAKLQAVYAGKKEVLFKTPQNTTGFKVLMTSLTVEHKEPSWNSRYLCEFTLVSREQVSGPIVEEEEDLPTIVRKTADETVNFSVTYQNDDELLFAVGANEVWVGQFVLKVAIKAASDIKAVLSVPAGANYELWFHGDPTQTAGEVAVLGQGVSGIPRYTSDATIGIIIEFLVNVGGTAGNVILQWAQASAVAENTQILTDSYLIAWKQ